MTHNLTLSVAILQLSQELSIHVSALMSLNAVLAFHVSSIHPLQNN
jgi:hypothetical protein